MLTKRQEDILKLIVEHYIKLAKPIGSKLICKKLKCSSATVRNEMATLENVGLLEKTHTSSGRIPSEEGYRYYVDNLMELKKMNAEDMLKLQMIFRNQQLPLADCITKSLQIISDMTSYATIALGTNSHENLLKQIEAVPIDENNIVVIVITDKGHVEHKEMRLENISLEEIKKTVNLINNLIIGTPIDEVSAKLEYEVKPIIGKYVKQHEVLYNAFYNAFSEFSNSSADVCFAGKSNFLNQPEFSDVGKLKELMSKFDDVNNIKKEEKNGINIYVGKDSEISDDVSVVKTKYNINGEEGTIAIVGPKRMEYDRVVSLLDYIKENIGGNDE